MNSQQKACFVESNGGGAHRSRAAGIQNNKFLWYIEEMEWRYNHRDFNLFELLVEYMLGQIIDNQLIF